MVDVVIVGRSCGAVRGVVCRSSVAIAAACATDVGVGTGGVVIVVVFWEILFLLLVVISCWLLVVLVRLL